MSPGDPSSSEANPSVSRTGAPPDHSNGDVVDSLASQASVDRARLPARSALWIPVVVFALTRVIDTILILVMSSHQTHAREDGPLVMVVDPAPAHPGYLDMLTNWDGQWYQQIAERGYPSHLPTSDGEVQQNAWAFYPLYPALVRLVMSLSGLPFAAAATLVSLSAGFAAAVLVFRLLEPRVGAFHAGMTVLVLGLSPAGVVLQAAYTESLALLLVVACLGLLAARRYGLLMIASTALALTRPIVLPLALVIVVHGVVRWRRRGELPFRRAEMWRCAAAVAVTVASFTIWPVVCALRTGVPDGFLQTQQAWISASSGQPTWLAATVHGFGGAAAGAALIAVLVLLATVLRPNAPSWGLEWRAWAITYSAYVFLVTLPVAAVLRYAMLTVIPWWPFNPEAVGRTPQRRAVTIAVVVAFGISTQVAWMTYFYVIGPHLVTNP